MNLYGFVDNSSPNYADGLGLTINACCIDSYLASLGLAVNVDYKVEGRLYTALRGVTSSDSMDVTILLSMMKSSYTFTVAGGSAQQVPNLKAHVAARETIVNNALGSKVNFGRGSQVTSPSPWNNPNPQAYYDSLNNSTTSLGCHIWSLIIFQTGNNYNLPGTRPYPDVWIPGDWGYIINENFSHDGTWLSGLEGENVFYVGGGLFWGLFASGVHPGMTEDAWWSEIKGWSSSAGVHGDPKWKASITYPSTGLSN